MNRFCWYSMGLALALLVNVVAARAIAEGREVIGGVSTERALPGVPYDLAGKRVVFTNWYFVQPGDLDWRDAAGKSVYVDGDSGLHDATFVGIRAPHGVRLQAEKPVVRGPIDLPYRTVLKDGEVYKGWTSTEYMESSDGMHWEKKALLNLGEGHQDGVSHVFIDPSGLPGERFKSVWVGTITRAEFEAFREKRPDAWEPRALFLAGEKDEVSCLRGSVSPDGITWTMLPDPLVVEYSDTLNTCYFDVALGKYVIYTRYWAIGPATEKIPVNIRDSWTGYGRRAIGRSESADFRSFPPSELILEPGPELLPSEVLYTNCRTTVPGAPDQPVMFPTIWNASINDTTRIAMASSSDGKNWHWVPGGDLLETAAFGQWNGGCIWALPELLELPNGDWALPYIGHNVPHKYPRAVRTSNTGYALWKRGRMCAVVADDVGEFTMIPIMVSARAVKVNAVTTRAGWVKIEVVGRDGCTLADAVPLVGDVFGEAASWRTGNTLDLPGDQPVTLRIELKEARLFGLDFE